jgi:hypothetical protein
MFESMAPIDCPTPRVNSASYGVSLPEFCVEAATFSGALWLPFLGFIGCNTMLEGAANR